jgi:hypothetical protein
MASMTVRRRYIPDAAFTYAPTKDDIMFQVEDSTQRCMFHSDFPLLPHEQKGLEVFRQYIQQNKLELPPNYDNEERLILRFIDAAQWKCKEAWDQLMIHYKFTQSFPIQISQYNSWVEELNKGYAYIYKRDRCFRPLFIMNVNKLKNTKADQDTLVHMCTYVI